MTKEQALSLLKDSSFAAYYLFNSRQSLRFLLQLSFELQELQHELALVKQALDALEAAEAAEQQ